MLSKTYTISTGDIYKVIFDVDKIVVPLIVTVWAKHISGTGGDSEPPVTENSDGTVTTTDIAPPDIIIRRDKSKSAEVKYETKVTTHTDHNYNASWIYADKNNNVHFLGNGLFPSDLVNAIVKLKEEIDLAISMKFSETHEQTLSAILVLLGYTVEA